MSKTIGKPAPKGPLSGQPTKGSSTLEESKRVRTGPPDGHPRYGGRRKGSLGRKTVAIKELAEKLGVDPVGYLCAIVGCNGAIQVPVTDETTGAPLKGEDGKPVLKWIAVSLRQRLDAAKELIPYLAQKLSAVQVSGQDGAPVEVATLDITQILADPKMAEAAQRLALQLAEQMDPNAPRGEPAVPDDKRLAPIRRSRHE